MVPFQALLMVRHTVHAACQQETGEQVRTAVHDFEGDQTYSEAGPQFHAECRIHAIRAEDYDALVIPWRPCPQYLRLNPEVLAAVQHFASAKKPIAAICHGAQLLTAAGVVSGRACSAYPACGPEVKAAGGVIPISR